MWPEIVRTIEAGGGYLTCATDDGETRQAFESRAETIAARIVQIRSDPDISKDAGHVVEASFYQPCLCPTCARSTRKRALQQHK